MIQRAGFMQITENWGKGTLMKGWWDKSTIEGFMWSTAADEEATGAPRPRRNKKAEANQEHLGGAGALRLSRNPQDTGKQQPARKEHRGQD
jgi:hypothetical protein